MPEEIFIIIVVAIVAGTLSGIISQFFSYLKSRGPKTAEGHSMTTSELEGMIQKWIREATKPLVDRIERMEEHLDMDALPAKNQAGNTSILDDMEGYETTEEPDRLATRRREK